MSDFIEDFYFGNIEPQECTIEPDEHSILPEGIETAPRRFAINYRNKPMLNKSDIVATCVTRNFGGAWEFKHMAVKNKKKVFELFHK